jgi:hypothetical protein
MAMRTYLLLGFLAVVAATSAACMDAVVTDLSDDGSDKATPTPESTGLPVNVTYWKDIRPVMESTCVECHAAGGVGGFALDTFDKAKAYATASMTAVEGKRMPPWPPDPTCREYKGQRVLSDLQRQLFRAWVDAGTPEGVESDYEPRPDIGIAEPSLGAPSRSLDAGGDYTFDVANGPQDLYWCFRLNPGITAPTDFTAADITPGNKEIVHHVIVFREANGQANATGLPGFQCDGAPGEFLFAWVPGSGALRFPEGVGMQLQPNDRLLMQMHYSKVPTAATQVDRTQAKLYFAESPVQQRARVLWLGTIGIDVPAGQTATASGECAVGGNEPLNVLMTAPHMHKMAVSHKATVARNDGSEACLVDVPRWDFGWQGGYMVKDAFQVMPGETITTSCTWTNNTAADAGFGEGTGDEMCFNFLYVTGNTSVPRYCFPGGGLLELSGGFGGATAANATGTAKSRPAWLLPD